MTKPLKQYLLGYIYEQLEKNVYNIKNGHGDVKNLQMFTSWLDQLDKKDIQDKNLINALNNMKDSTKIYDMPKFINNLINGCYKNDQDLTGKVRNFQTPSFF